MKVCTEDKLDNVHGQLDEVKGIMIQNIEKVVDRGQRIEVLLEASDDLTNNADLFRMKSRKLASAMWKRNIALICVLLVIIVIVIAVIIWIACGVTFNRCIDIFKKK